jgi:integral membrane protein
MKTNRTFSWFRKIAFAEGVSFLILLFIAMPLKYLADIPIAVTVVGGIHGALFVAFMVMIYLVREGYQKDLRWSIKAFLASIIPFGTFIMDREWKSESEGQKQKEKEKEKE